MNASCKSSIASEVHARHKRPHRLALLATSPVATGEAKIGESPQGDGTHAPSQSAKQKSSHIFSGCSFRVLSLMRFSLPANIIKENSMKRSFLIGRIREILFSFVSGIL